MALMVDVAANHREINQPHGRGAAKAGRDVLEIRLLAAAKSQSIEAVRTAIAAVWL